MNLFVYKQRFNDLNVEIMLKKLKGNFKSQTKPIKFEEYKNCLDREEYQRECNNCI